MIALGDDGRANSIGNLNSRETAVIAKKWEPGEDAFAYPGTWLANLDLLYFAYSGTNPVVAE